MIHINKFIDKIKMLESRQAKNLTMSLQEAKDLHADITKLLLVLEELHSKNNNINEIIIKGNDW